MKKETLNKKKNTTKETPPVRRVAYHNAIENRQRIITSFELVPLLTVQRLQKMIDQHFQDTIDTV